MNDKGWSNTVALDFDGVIAKFGTEDAGEPVPGAIDGIRRLATNGWYIEIFSGRSATRGGRQFLKQWLCEHETVMQYLISTGRILFPKDKPVAKIYIDDRGLRFDGDWSKITPDALEAYRAWWQHSDSTK